MKKYILIAIGFITLLLVGTYLQFYRTSSQQDNEKALYWVAPMDPTYRRDKPGKSPMGMDLVPVYADDQAIEGPGIRISPTVEQNLGVRTAPVMRQNLSRTINTVGYVTVNENNISKVNTYTDGWVKNLAVKTTGEYVAAGQLLFQIYSPTLVNAQEEYLLALKSNNGAIRKASHQKLLALGLAETQINKIGKSKQVSELVDYYAEQSGFVSDLQLKEGMYVKPGQNLIVLENLSDIWIIAEVFERQAQWVQKDQRVVATLAYLPGEKWEGKVEYVYPQLDPITRTLKVRLHLANPREALKPSMYADVTIFANPEINVLTIPREAVIYTGEGARVIVSLGKGQYIARPVKLGIEAEERIVVLEGLKSGEVVVTSAQFLIDSESNLKASLARVTSDQQNAVPSHQH